MRAEAHNMRVQQIYRGDALAMVVVLFTVFIDVY
jgi:hypothetical protein